MHIKNLRDCPEVIDTLAEWFLDGFYYEEVKKREELHWLTESLQSSELLPITFVAFEENVPVGTARIFHHEMPDRSHLTPWFAYCYVDPEYRGRGIARALYQARLSYCLSHGIERAYLYTSILEPTYLERGWEVIERRQWFGRNVAIMSGRLKPFL